VCLFRKTESKEYIYRSKEFMHYGIFIAFGIGNLFLIGWLFLWDNFFFGWALFMVGIGTISIGAALFISLRKNYAFKNYMSKLDIWINRLIVHNGIGLFVTWLLVLTILKFSLFLTYETGIETRTTGDFINSRLEFTIPNKIVLDTSSIIGLIIIFFIMITYFILENFIWQR
jgi:hypothetical protein